MGDIAKELGRRWAAAEPETKSKYEALSEQDKARYDRVSLYYYYFVSYSLLHFSFRNLLLLLKKKTFFLYFSLIHNNGFLEIVFATFIYSLKEIVKTEELKTRTHLSNLLSILLMFYYFLRAWLLVLLVEIIFNVFFLLLIT